MTELKNIENLPVEVQKKYIPFLRKFLELYPSPISTVAVYGSAVTPHYIPGRSDINSVIITLDTGFTNLNPVLKLIVSGVKQKISAPLLLTKAYIQSSLDSFPIEFLDIKENHVSIYGEDFFTPLDITDQNLRLFCEHQIKGKLIRIRQSYMENGLNARAVEMLLKESLNALIPVFKNIWRLKSGMIVVDKAKILAEISKEFNLDAEVFLAIYNYRTQNQKMSLQVAQNFMEKYFRQIEKLAEAVDQL
ncbi:MAG: hypothetical protein HQL26_03120 [Candidatus Omnitrophica bacterium]|nr:hypothetical protein [Candidatus Omnitrophota bacterium]